MISKPSLHQRRQALDYLFRRGEFPKAPRPGLILIDLNLPGTNGREVLRIVKTDPDLKKIPVVVLTISSASEESDIRLRFSSARMDLRDVPRTCAG
jgi:CheY-like chemotaxis protein